MIFLEFLEQSIIDNNFTKKRISAYRSTLGLKEEDIPDKFIFGLYISMQSITALLYPPIHFLEVILRNRMNNYLCEDFGDFWYESISLMPNTHSEIKFIHNTLIKEAKKNGKIITNDDLICNLTLGVWVHLLDKANRSSDNNISAFWGAKANKVFSGIGSKKIGNVRDLLGEIHVIRNRFIHHEPIWKKDYMTGEFFNQSTLEKYNIACNEINNIFDKIIEGINICEPRMSNIVKISYRKKITTEIEIQKENLITQFPDLLKAMSNS